MWSKHLVAVFLLTASRGTLAQRSDNESICDYYAARRYGESNSTTQLRLVEGIVSLAYAGGNSLPEAIDNSTGIFNEGNFGGLHVYLRPWFDGSKATTNLNNQPVGIDWLDGGATGPLVAFLNGSTDSVVLDNSTNQHRLFTHWFTAFGYVYGCSRVSDFPQTAGSGARLSIAYVHKYMNLNQTHIGYFINQLTLASKYFGFSDQDAQTLDTSMNARYNVRCAPAVNGQLYSLCLAKECPLAQPNPDCDAYTNLTPSGSDNNKTIVTTVTPTSAGPTTTASTATSTSTAGISDSNPSLSGGAIAGIAIGSAAVLLLAIGLWLFFRRQAAKPHIVPVPVPSGGYGSPSHASHSYYSPNPHTSFAPSGPHDSYMGGYGGLPGFWAPKPHEMGQNIQEVPPSATSPGIQIAEMESPGYPPIEQVPPRSISSPTER